MQYYCDVKVFTPDPKRST